LPGWASLTSFAAKDSLSRAMQSELIDQLGWMLDVPDQKIGLLANR
jgi:hypothetical protein